MINNNPTTPKVPGAPELDADLAGVLKETQSAFQSLIKIRKDLRSSQLEAKINKDQLQSARQRLEANDSNGIPSDWNRLSKSLHNIIKVVSDRKDIAEYEQTIRKLSDENERLSKQITSLGVDHEEALEKQKMELKKQLDKETAQYSKQISELIIDKELAASEASIKYDQLQSRVERMKSENEDRRNAIVAQYEKLVQSLSDQKHKLREENMALQRREMELRDQMDHLQNHSTDFLLGMGRRVSPIGGSAISGSQRYAEVVEIIPLQGGATQTFSSKATVSRVENGSQQSSQFKEINRGETNVPETVEVSSSCSNFRAKNHGSPQHPGLGGHVAKPRKKRKLFSQTNDE